MSVQVHACTNTNGLCYTSSSAFCFFCLKCLWRSALISLRRANSASWLHPVTRTHCKGLPPALQKMIVPAPSLVIELLLLRWLNDGPRMSKSQPPRPGGAIIMAKGTLHMRLRILQWGHNAGRSAWVQGHNKGPCKRKRHRSEEEVGNVTMEVRGCSDVKEGPQVMEHGQPPETEKAWEGVLPWNLQKEPALRHLDLSSVRLILKFRPSALEQNMFVLSQATKCVVICFCSHKK